MDRSTIVAISTPEGFGGIGIVKISGPDAISAAASIFRRAGSASRVQTAAQGPGNNGFESWRLHFGHVIDPDTCRKIDEAVLAVMRAPHSYTREDVVEIQAHAGPKVLQRILDLLVSRGLRPAEPGEFTRRAFLNGRIDLTQAEAVADLIHARSNAALEMAVSQMSGALSAHLGSVRQELVSVLASIEAAIDFPEAAGDEIDPDPLIRSLQESVAAPLRDMIDAYETGRCLREGIRAAIIGRPNVGKSSLLNRLIGQDRAIVTDIPGTTRDCIEVPFTSRGIAVILADTAGLSEDPDPVERLGIEKARQCMHAADMLLFVADAGRPATPEDIRVIEQLPDRPLLLVINKSDLPEGQKRFRVPPPWEALPRVVVSALCGHGIDTLRETMADMAALVESSENQCLAPNWRQKTLIDRATEAVSRAVTALSGPPDFELAAIDINEALSAVNEITGDHVRPDVLDRIFSRYCVGK